MTCHELKTIPNAFDAVYNGRKTAEFRADDRTPKFKVGQFLHLREYDLNTNEYSGRWVVVQISDVRSDAFGIPEGFAMLSFWMVCKSPTQE